MDAYRNVSEYARLSSIGITRGSVARIENGRGMVLRVETGSVWLTQDRSADDVLLQAGMTFRIERAGTTLLSALGPRFALVSIEPSIPLAPAPAERFWNFWAGLYVMPTRPAMTGL